MHFQFRMGHSLLFVLFVVSTASLNYFLPSVIGLQWGGGPRGDAAGASGDGTDAAGSTGQHGDAAARSLLTARKTGNIPAIALTSDAAVDAAAPADDGQTRFGFGTQWARGRLLGEAGHHRGGDADEEADEDDDAEVVAAGHIDDHNDDHEDDNEEGDMDVAGILASAHHAQHEAMGLLQQLEQRRTAEAAAAAAAVPPPFVCSGVRIVAKDDRSIRDGGFENGRVGMPASSPPDNHARHGHGRGTGTGNSDGHTSAVGTDGYPLPDMQYEQEMLVTDEYGHKMRLPVLNGDRFHFKNATLGL